jgi:ABC-type nitrate/sulfonate/bicarbonate transport system permease component
MTAAFVERRGVRLGLGVVGLAAALLVWQSVGSSGNVTFLVPFSDALSAMWSLLSGDPLRDDVLPSVQRTVAGFALGVVVGVTLGVLLGYFRGLDAWVRPVLEFLRATPIPAIIPVAVLTLGATGATRIGLIALGSLWPVLLNAMDGTRGVDPGYLDAARTAHLSDREILRRVIFPASLPRIFTGMRIGLALSLVMMVVSEMVAADNGLGHLVLQAQRTYALNDMYGGILLLGLLGGLFTLVFAAVERRVLSWYAGQKGLSHA